MALKVRLLSRLMVALSPILAMTDPEAVASLLVAVIPTRLPTAAMAEDLAVVPPSGVDVVASTKRAVAFKLKLVPIVALTVGDNVIFGNETPTATVVDIAEPMAVALTSGVELAFTDMSPVRIIATLLPTVALTTGVTLVVASCPTAA
jgi:hypothetical protein